MAMRRWHRSAIRDSRSRSPAADGVHGGRKIEPCAPSSGTLMGEVNGVARVARGERGVDARRTGREFMLAQVCRPPACP